MTMRPLLVASSYAPHVGGVEQVVEQFALALRARGDEPLVLTNRWPKSLPRSEIVREIPVRRQLFRTPGGSARQTVRWLLEGAAIRRGVLGIAAQHRVSVVNLHCSSSNTRYALAAAQALDVPLVMSLHGELTADANGVYERSADLRKQWRRALDAAALVTAPSRYALATAEDAYGRPFGDRGVVLRNGVDLGRFVPGTSRRGVLAIGRLVRIKGFDLLLDAWQRVPVALRRSHPLCIVGDGPERPVLEALARATSDVTFTGGLDAEDVAARLSASAALVMPSRDESLGLVALEAMAAGTPVVAARVGGIPEIVQPGRTGLLVDAAKPDELSAVLAKVLNGGTDIDRLVREARQQVKGLSWSAYTERMVEAFRKVGAA